MKKVFFLITCICFYSCIQQQNIYYGYVYGGITKKPLSSVEISILNSNRKSYSDENGYFEVRKIKNISSDLIFEKELYCKDTVPSVTIMNGEKQILNFRGDTIFLFKVEDKNRILFGNK